MPVFYKAVCKFKVANINTCMHIVNHWLEGDNIRRQLTPNLYNPPEFKDANLPDTIILHYTAGGTTSGAVSTLTTKREKGNASAHIVLGRDGEIVQLAPFHYRTWHAGESSYKGRNFLNSYSIGIEIVNLGWLEPSGDAYSRYDLLKAGVFIPASDVVEARHLNPSIPYKYWHKYTDVQISRVIELCRLLADTYPIGDITGHDVISPGRKQDPGPAFPMAYVAKEVMPDDRGADTFVGNSAKVAVPKLNIRSEAAATADKVALPLSLGQEVTILEQSNGWCRVRTTLEGWVSADFLETT